LCNYFQIAYGEGIEEQFSFNLNQFCGKYEFPILKTYNAMQFLDRQGIITLSQEFSEKVTVQFIIPSKEVLRYMSLNRKDEPILLALLRSYPGIHEVPATLNMAMIAKKAETNETSVNALLHQLMEKGIIEYHAKSNDTRLIFNVIREDERTINGVSKYLEIQNNLKKEQLKSVLEFVKDTENCKSKLVLNYFGEKSEENCGICSYCIGRKAPEIETEDLRELILKLLKVAPLNSREIQIHTKKSTDAIIFALQKLLESDCILIKPNNKYTLKS
jgi:ATP-dependent DNA helicase RecQ